MQLARAAPKPTMQLARPPARLLSHMPSVQETPAEKTKQKHDPRLPRDDGDDETGAELDGDRAAREYADTPMPELDPLHPLHYYRLFPSAFPHGPPPKGSFDVDLGLLKKDFLQFQRSTHPDLASAQDKQRAEAMSSYVNTAYRTLEKPLARAQYLLQTRGIDMHDDGMTLGAGEGELLMLVMEVREQIEGAACEEELEPIRAANDTRMRDSEAVLRAAFAADDLETARSEAVRLRYWVNVDEALRNWGEAAGTFLNDH